MNKLMGFFELREMDLPAIPWHEYTGRESMNSDLLWTIRSAVLFGNDFNLPRLVGVDSNKAQVFAEGLLETFADKGMVIYYPYFIAEKSGNLNIFSDKIVIEAVNEDLWNLVTYSDRDLTIIIEGKTTVYDGDKNFLSSDEVDLLLTYVTKLRNLFRDDLMEGKSILLEWSFAYDSTINHEKTGVRAANIA